MDVGRKGVELGDSTVIARDCGFEIVRDGNTVILADRRTLPPALTAAITGGLALLGGALALVIIPSMVRQQGGSFGAGHYQTMGIAGAAALVTALFSALSFRAWRRRASAPVADLPGSLLADLERRMLSLKGGPDLAPFSDIEASVDTDPVDHSRGLMLLVVLRWPRGRARVFKTNSSPEAARVRGELQRLGVVGRT